MRIFSQLGGVDWKSKILLVTDLDGCNITYCPCVFISDSLSKALGSDSEDEREREREQTRDINLYVSSFFSQGEKPPSFTDLFPIEKTTGKKRKKKKKKKKPESSYKISHHHHLLCPILLLCSIFTPPSPIYSESDSMLPIAFNPLGFWK